MTQFSDISEEELKIWFCNIFNSCQTEHRNDITSMYYDPTLIRHRKLCRVLYAEVAPKLKARGKKYFEIDHAERIFWCDYTVWSKFEECFFLPSSYDIQCFIEKILNEKFPNYSKDINKYYSVRKAWLEYTI